MCEEHSDNYYLKVRLKEVAQETDDKNNCKYIFKFNYQEKVNTQNSLEYGVAYKMMDYDKGKEETPSLLAIPEDTEFNCENDKMCSFITDNNSEMLTIFFEIKESYKIIKVILNYE